ncbi:MAG: phosphatase PAP2 family protein [Actinomycetota bacterium]
MGIGRVVWGGALAAGACAVGVAAIRGDDGPAVDRELFEQVNRGHGPQADRIFSGVTELGSLYASGGAAAALIATGRGRAAARAGAAALTTWVLLQALKRVVDRPRPSDADPAGTILRIARPHAQSWPSSHPAVLTTFTRVASRELRSGAMTRAALSGVDLTVAASRVYLGVHYPSDVASGLLFGRAVARLWPRGRA